MSRRQIKCAIGDEFLIGPLAGIVAEYAELEDDKRFKSLVKRHIALDEITVVASECGRYLCKVSFSMNPMHTMPIIVYAIKHLDRPMWHTSQERYTRTQMYKDHYALYWDTKAGAHTRVFKALVGSGCTLTFGRTIEQVLLGHIDAEPRKS